MGRSHEVLTREGRAGFQCLHVLVLTHVLVLEECCVSVQTAGLAIDVLAGLGSCVVVLGTKKGTSPRPGRCLDSLSHPLTSTLEICEGSA